MQMPMHMPSLKPKITWVDTVLAIVASIAVLLTGLYVRNRVLVLIVEGKTNATKNQMSILGELLSDYKKACGQYPTTEQGLITLVTPPNVGPACPKRRKEDSFMRGVPTDGYERPFIYVSDGRTFTITSYGYDGKLGGSGIDQDIVSESPK